MGLTIATNRSRMISECTLSGLPPVPRQRVRLLFRLVASCRARVRRVRRPDGPDGLPRDRSERAGGQGELLFLFSIISSLEREEIISVSLLASILSIYVPIWNVDGGSSKREVKNRFH